MRRAKRQSWWSLTKIDAVFVAAGVVLFAAGVVIPAPDGLKIVLIVLGLALIAFGVGLL